MDHKRVAQTVVKAVGKDNIVAAAHCATRLRLVVKDDSKINQKMLDSDADIKGTFETNGQYQIIIGPGDVNNVYDEMVKITGLKEMSTQELKQVAAKNQKTNPVMAFIKLLSDIFVPLIPALVAGGLLMALDNVLASPGLFGPKSVIQMYPSLKGIGSAVYVPANSGWDLWCQAVWCQPIFGRGCRYDDDLTAATGGALLERLWSARFNAALHGPGYSGVGCSLAAVDL